MGQIQQIALFEGTCRDTLGVLGKMETGGANVGEIHSSMTNQLSAMAQVLGYEIRKLREVEPYPRGTERDSDG